MKFIRGMGAGILVGACIGMVMAPDKKSSRRQVGSAVRSVGKAIEDFGGAIRF